MSLLTYFNTDHLRSVLRTSNYWAIKNRNEYPIKLENALRDLYEWISCPCDDSCECKQHGCERHLVRKSDLSFQAHFDHFLHCYVDISQHEKIEKTIASGSTCQNRGKNSVAATHIIKKNWGHIAQHPGKQSLICTEWEPPYFAKVNNGSKSKPGQSNIYTSKWLCLLSMGVFVAYDSSSILLLNKDYHKPATYLDLMTKIREALISHLYANGISISEFCMIDNPGELLGSNRSSLMRPIGSIIDKLYLTL